MDFYLPSLPINTALDRIIERTIGVNFAHVKNVPKKALTTRRATDDCLLPERGAEEEEKQQKYRQILNMSQQVDNAYLFVTNK